MYVLSTQTVPMAVRMHIQGSVQSVNHLDVLKKRKGERADAEKSVQITTSYSGCWKNMQMFFDATQTASKTTVTSVQSSILKGSPVTWNYTNDWYMVYGLDK